jgi:hypothetical protein
MTPGSGMITGGWGFVWAVYGLTWTVVIVYLSVAWSLSRRSK